MNFTILDFNTLGTILTFLVSGFAGVQASKARSQAEETHAQTQPNHGSSMRDKVDLTLEIVKSHDQRLGEIKDNASFVHGQLADGQKELREEVKLLKQAVNKNK